MKQMKCSDVGGDDCTFVATGETNEEVIEKMTAHGSSVHMDKMEAMMKLPEEQQKEEMQKWHDMAVTKITEV